jgi:hypothetical protein
MPDGSFAVIASLLINRPLSGSMRARMVNEQPIPLRATDDAARKLNENCGQVVQISGVLRRRYYNQNGEQRWGQVEVWVDTCRPAQDMNTKNTQER